VIAATRPPRSAAKTPPPSERSHSLLATTSETPDAESTAPAAEQPDEADVEPDPVPRLNSAALERLRQQLT
jgi:hypothetical protein